MVAELAAGFAGSVQIPHDASRLCSWASTAGFESTGPVLFGVERLAQQVYDGPVVVVEP